MRVRLFRENHYTYTWPEPLDQADFESEEAFKEAVIPDDELIKFKLKRLEHGKKRKIENSMISAKAGAMARGREKRNGNTPEEVRLQYSIGDIKDMKLKESVYGWENVNDEDGNPIRFSWEKFCDLLAINAGQDSNIYGLLENDLISFIDAENSFADSQSVTPKNSPPTSSTSSAVKARK